MGSAAGRPSEGPGDLRDPAPGGALPGQATGVGKGPRAGSAHIRGRTGAVLHRPRLLARLNAWRKHSPLSPYWLDWVYLRNSVAELAPLASGWMLDVGVAERPYGEVFRPHVERYVGLDYPPALLQIQPELWNILDRTREAMDVFGDGNRMPFRDACFDSVLCTEVLEHLTTPERCLREVGRVLKPGGRLLLTVPFTQPLHQLPQDYYRFTPGSLEDLAVRAGLEVESIEARGNFASALGALSSQFVLRTFGAISQQSDGSVILSRWRSVLLLPFLALMQLAFRLLARVTNDQTAVQGYSLVARKPGQHAERSARVLAPEPTGARPRPAARS